MPLPILQQTIEVPSLEKDGCRIFVSYSHKDMEDAKEFMKFLALQLRATPEIGMTEEHVFFDRNKLKAGEDWDESIQTALDEAQYFIFLVSADSLFSKYCFTRELATAVAGDLPILPIILKTCPWEKQPVPEDKKKRRLGAFGALPKDNHFSLRPIGEWAEPEKAAAWNTVVHQLTDRLLTDKKKPPNPKHESAMREVRHSQPMVTPLLPYFCNQTHVETQFNGQVQMWSGSQALLVLARGILDDNVPRFWDRLRTKNLKDYLISRNGQLLESKPLIWPLAADLKLDPQRMASAMMGALSQALTDNAFKLNNPSSFAQHLAELPGIVPLVTSLPKESKKLLAEGVGTLMKLIEQCPEDTPLDRLVITMVIEDESLVAVRDLGKFLKLVGYKRAHLIDLRPLKEIDQEDIRSWHRNHDVGSKFSVSESELLISVFGNNPDHPLRLRQFAEKVKAFL